jgi:hypothetical protein
LLPHRNPVAIPYGGRALGVETSGGTYLPRPIDVGAQRGIAGIGGDARLGHAVALYPTPRMSPDARLTTVPRASLACTALPTIPRPGTTRPPSRATSRLSGPHAAWRCKFRLTLESQGASQSQGPLHRRSRTASALFGDGHAYRVGDRDARREVNDVVIVVVRAGHSALEHPDPVRPHARD